jgi:hypothetical protein
MEENNLRENPVSKQIKNAAWILAYEGLIAFIVYWGVVNKSNVLALLYIYFAFLVFFGSVGFAGLFFAISLNKTGSILPTAKKVISVPIYCFIISLVLRFAESLFLAHNNYIFLSVMCFMSFGLIIAIRKTSNIILSKATENN